MTPEGAERINISVRSADLAEIDRRRGDTPRSHYLVQAALREPGSLEDAIETVLAHLESIQREDLAAAVAIATDPATPEERAEHLAQLRAMLRARGAA